MSLFYGISNPVKLTHYPAASVIIIRDEHIIISSPIADHSSRGKNIILPPSQSSRSPLSQLPQRRLDKVHGWASLNKTVYKFPQRLVAIFHQFLFVEVYTDNKEQSLFLLKGSFGTRRWRIFISE